MIFQSPAKINLYLHIKGKYQNNFHEIDSLFVRIDLHDDLDISCTQDPYIERFGDLSHLRKNDLCYRAAIALKEKSGCNLGCRLTLKKRIPIGAGLGGGSSNAATVLMGLNRLWELKYSKDELKFVGKQIGADVPFFIEQSNCFATGMGENLNAIKNEQFIPKFYVILTPNIKISTALVFKKFQLNKQHLTRPKMSVLSRAEMLSSQKPYFTFGCNDLESTVSYLFPMIKKYIREMKNVASMLGIPVECCRMSGSGSTLFCGFYTKEAAVTYTQKLCDHLKKSQIHEKPNVLISSLFH